MPVLVGKWRNSSIAASNPPADPPMPTIGQLNFALAGSDLGCALANFDCDDLLSLVFTREKGVLDFAFRLAAMPLFMIIAAFPNHKPRMQRGGRVVLNAVAKHAALQLDSLVASVVRQPSPSEKSIHP